METVKLKGIYNKLTPVASIVYVEGEKEYTRFHFVDGRSLRLSMHVAAVHRLLPAFTRIHKSYLVNPVFIQNWRHTDSYWPKQLRLTTGTCLPIAYKRFRPFLDNQSNVHNLKR